MFILIIFYHYCELSLIRIDGRTYKICYCTDVEKGHKIEENKDIERMDDKYLYLIETKKLSQL